MATTIGINWYARLQAKIADLDHKLEDVQAHNKELIKKDENNSIRTTRNGKDNNVVKSSGRIYTARDKT